VIRALVTGGAGFIGSQVADALLAKGIHVEIIDNLFTGRRENLPGQAVFHETDIRDAEVDNIFAKGKFDVMFHLAAQMDVRKSVADPAFDAAANILGGINLLQTCKKHGVKKVIFSSTGGAVYGEQEKFPADESHPLNPRSPYGISKLAFEKYLQFYHWEYGLDYVALRYANVYGPRQRSDGEAGVVAIFFGRLLTGKKAVIFGDGKQTRDFVYAGDVVKANLLALDYDKCGVFNVGTGIETNINELFDTIKDITGSKQKQIHEPALPGEQRRSVVDYNLIKKTLGWNYDYGLRDGLEKAAEYFRPRARK
jgi:UDP-glucose 4-epimerase